MSISQPRRGNLRPDGFGLDRNPEQKLLYSRSIHLSPGSQLARLEVRVPMKEFLTRTRLMTTVPAHSRSGPIIPRAVSRSAAACYVGAGTRMAAPSPLAPNLGSSRLSKISARGNFRHTAFLAESDPPDHAVSQGLQSTIRRSRSFPVSRQVESKRLIQGHDQKCR